MLYRVIGKEVTTHRRVEIPNWDAPNIATAKRLAEEIGVVVSRIEPMDAPARECKRERIYDDIERLGPDAVTHPAQEPKKERSYDRMNLAGTDNRAHSVTVSQTARRDVEINGWQYDATTEPRNVLIPIVVCVFGGLVYFLLLYFVYVPYNTPFAQGVITLLSSGSAIGLAIVGLICCCGFAIYVIDVITAPGRAEARRDKVAHDGKLFCPHCQKVGCVTTKATTVKRGISGGKMTAALLTGGWSLLATGLAQEDTMTKATCSNCGSTWMF